MNRIRWPWVVGITAVAALVLAGVAVWLAGTRAPSVEPPQKPLTRPPRAGARWISKEPTDLPAPLGARGPATVEIDLEAQEVVGRVNQGTTYTYWTFGGTVPGPMLRVRLGDTVLLRLRNAPNNGHTHSVDLHAVNGPGGGAAAVQLQPGEEKRLRFKALNPGLYIYHCASAFVPTHVANGMYGLILVEPPAGLPPVDREFYVVQGEIYTNLRPGEEGDALYDPDAMWAENPNYVVFNGAYQAVTAERSLHARTGERIRIFFGNAGPNLASSFHVIGEIFDIVHPEAAAETFTDVQSTLVPAGGATWVEFTVEVPGKYVLVDHSLNRAFGKGALAILDVEGPPNHEVYHPLDETERPGDKSATD